MALTSLAVKAKKGNHGFLKTKLLPIFRETITFEDALA